jgi:hypothetical protein
MKQLVTLTFLLLSFIGLSAQRDTLTVSQNTTSGVIRINSQRSSSLSINPFQYNGYGNIEAVYSTAGADTMVFLRNVKTQTVLARYRKTQFYFANYGITAMTATWLNATYFNPPNLRQLNVTTAIRDSLYNWGLAPTGTIIFNTTIDSAQVKASGTIWRTL